MFTMLTIAYLYIVWNVDAIFSFYLNICGSDVRQKNCPENFIFFPKSSENFHCIFPENFLYFSIIRILLYHFHFPSIV